MRTFRVYLRDGRSATVSADAYRHEGKQYVFSRASTSEVQFFVDSEVVGISEGTQPLLPEAPRSQEDRVPLLAKVEAEAIVRALVECGWNRSHAARKLGISRRALLYKIKKLPREVLPDDHVA